MAEVTQEEFDAANLYRIQVVTYKDRADEIRVQKILRERNIDVEISEKRDEEESKFRLIAYKSKSIEKLNELK